MSTKTGEGFKLVSVVVLALFLFFFFLISLTTALQKSPTYDEPLHLFAGYSYLKWGDFRVNPEHPPLAKVLAALPMLAADVDIAEISRAHRDVVQQKKDYGWLLGYYFFLSNNNADTLLLNGKLVMIGLAVILGIFVFQWARELFGLSAGIAALAIYGLDPNVLAHSSIVHTDIPFALCFFAGTYFFWRVSCRVTWLNLFFTSLFFALSAITKFSFLVILPIWAVLGIIRVLSSEPQQSQITSSHVVHQPWPKLFLLLVVFATAVIVAYLAIWSAYGFRFEAVAYQKGQMPVDRLVSEEGWPRTLAALNSKYLLLPEAWVYGIIDAFNDFDRPSYLLSEISNDGFWHYFPIVFAVKTPLPTLILILIALVLAVYRRQLDLKYLFLLLPVVVFFSMAVWLRLNIGVRHILPIYPFLFVWLGGLVGTLWLSRNFWTRCGMLLFGIWLMGSSLRIYPDYLAFFNELAGGPENGHKILVDSNLDWGQDLKGLKRWMDAHGLKKIEFAYFGTVDPSQYGINAVPSVGNIDLLWRGDKDDSPKPPYIAISATYLAGLYLEQKDTYAAFRSKSPIASIGHSILVYRTDY
jgi:hypothetical protein